MEEKKYKLTEESIKFNGKTLYRIESLIDFGTIKKGDRGGFIESERNLSHEGHAWVSDNAKVFGNAIVYGDAGITDDARVSGDAEVFGHAWIHDNASVYGYAKVYGNAEVYEDGGVFDNAKVSGNAIVCGNTFVKNNARVFDNAKVSGNSCVCDNAWVFGNANVSGKALVSGNAKVSGDAHVCADEDYIVFRNWWSSLRYFTWTRSNNMWNVGCFYGTGEELIKKAYKDSEKSGREYERVVKYVESILGN